MTLMSFISFSFLGVGNRQKKLLICEIFCPPRRPIHSFLDSLNCFLMMVSADGPMVYIMGDLNINFLRYPKTTVSVDVLNLFLPHLYSYGQLHNVDNIS